MRCVAVNLGVGLAALLAGSSVLAGDLDPPGGAVVPTMKALDVVEPRTAISDATTPGDANSVYRIAAPGSYYLTENLVGQSGKHGIEIVASDVTIDLMGYELDGAAAGTLNGISATFGAGVSGVSVANGHVRGWIWGIELTGVDGGSVGDVQVRDTGDNGFFLGTAMLVHGCFVGGAAGNGFADSGFCRYRGCMARGSGFSGFAGGSTNSYEGCTAEDNSANGFSATSSCSWTGCTAQNNDQNGINGTFGSTVLGCTAGGNGGHGVFVSSLSLVRGNACSGNGTQTADGAGVATNGVDTRIDANNCVGNDVGVSVTMSGNLVVRNSASGNTSGNYSASITNVSGDPSTAGSWDNLTY